MADNEKEKERSSSQLAPFAIREFLENQKRELEVRAVEAQLKAQEDEHAFEHAGKALAAQERDRHDERNFRLRSAKHRYWFIGAILVISLLFIGSLAYMGKDQLATEIVKAAVYLAAGALGGFYYGKGKGAVATQVARNAVEDDSED